VHSSPFRWRPQRCILLNDVIDLDADRQASEQKLGPLAAGSVPPNAMALIPALLSSPSSVRSRSLPRSPQCCSPMYAHDRITFLLKRRCWSMSHIAQSLYTDRVVGRRGGSYRGRWSEWCSSSSILSSRRSPLNQALRPSCAARLDKMDLSNPTNRNLPIVRSRHRGRLALAPAQRRDGLRTLHLVRCVRLSIRIRGAGGSLPSDVLARTGRSLMAAPRLNA